MIFKRIPTWVLVLLLLIIIVAVALWLRVALPYNQVFVNDWVKLTGVDAYYYGRLLDNLASHFPNLTQFDPYFIFPGGASTTSQSNFFAYLMGGIVWLFSLGKPDQHLTDVIAVYIPPVLAALTIIASFFIGKALKNVWAGLLAAGMLAIMPGEFLNRSLLGYTDHHIAESLFVTCFIMFVMLAFKESEDISLDSIREKGWKSIIKPAVYCAVAGLSLAIYMLIWAGAALLPLILVLFLAIQIIIDYAKGRSIYTTGALGVAIILVGLIIYSPSARSYFTSLSIVAAIILVVIMTVIAALMSGRHIKSRYFILVLAVAGIVGIGLLYFVSPSTYALLFNMLIGIFRWYPGTTNMEMQPLLLQGNEVTFAIAYGNFTIGLFLGLAGLVLMTYQAIKKPEPLKILLIIWSVLMVLAALAMRRFAYYLAVNFAVLSGYFIWWILNLVGFGRQRMPEDNKRPAARTKAARIREAKAGKSSKGNPVFMVIVLVVSIFVMVYPNLGPLPDGSKPSIDVATRPLFAPSNAWFESLEWLRSNSPEPLENANAYYGQYKAPGEPGGFIYPQNAYGVLSWWDYGYWISRIARRIPFSNPGTNGLMGESKYLLAQDELSAANAIKDINIKYVIIDDEIASYDSKFFALPTWIGSSYQQYYDVYIQKQNDKYAPTVLFYPAYYQTMVVRLYNFDGKQVAPSEITVVGYDNVIASDNKQYKAINDIKKFTSTQEAEQFIASQKPKMYRIVGNDPYISPVPLDALKNYKLIYSSSQKKQDGPVTISYVKIFQYQSQ
ncbi:MAG: oligosaccharyl transferase, archaeosortase A system-associated [Chloroflexi bacterium]|nr:oligosaccharyl transferase, archaeosortase A system-associated [Chloroflexota bacterium]